MKFALTQEISRFSRVALRERVREISISAEIEKYESKLSRLLEGMRILGGEVESLRAKSRLASPNGVSYKSGRGLSSALCYMQSCVSAAERKQGELKLMDSFQTQCRSEVANLLAAQARHSQRAALCDARVNRAQRMILAGHESVEHTEIEEQFGFRRVSGEDIASAISISLVTAACLLPTPAWAQDAAADPLGGAHVVRTILALLFVCGLAMATLTLYAKRFGKRAASVDTNSASVVIRERVRLDDQSELIVVYWEGVGEMLIVKDARGAQVVAHKGVSGEVLHSMEGLSPQASFVEILEAVAPRKGVEPSDVH